MWASCAERNSKMAATRQCFCTFFVHTFLLSLCFFETFGGEESRKVTGSNTEVESSVLASSVLPESSRNSIKPGEFAIDPSDGRTNEGVKLSNDEKKSGIKQANDGKTTEEVKAPDETGPKDEEKEGENKTEENKIIDNKTQDGEKVEKQEAKEDENKTEENGIDLKILKDSDFEHLTQASSGATTGDWLVLFTTKDNCKECLQAEKEMKVVYERLKYKLNVAKVEKASSSKLTFKRFNIQDLPVVYLFHHGKKISFEGNKTVESFMKFIEGGFVTMPWTIVREPCTSFELFMDDLIDEVKAGIISTSTLVVLLNVETINSSELLAFVSLFQHMLRYEKNVCLVIFLTGLLVGISLTSMCGSILIHLLENFKDDEDDEQVRGSLQETPDMAKSKSE